jgi:hypothetical protein
MGRIHPSVQLGARRCDFPVRELTAWENRRPLGQYRKKKRGALPLVRAPLSCLLASKTGSGSRRCRRLTRLWCVGRRRSLVSLGRCSRSLCRLRCRCLCRPGRLDRRRPARFGRGRTRGRWSFRRRRGWSRRLLRTRRGSERDRSRRRCCVGRRRPGNGSRHWERTWLWRRKTALGAGAGAAPVIAG